MKQDTPKDRAEWLIRECGNTDLAFKHAAWALENAKKSETKRFWERAIKELRRTLSHELNNSQLIDGVDPVPEPYRNSLLEPSCSSIP